MNASLASKTAGSGSDEVAQIQDHVSVIGHDLIMVEKQQMFGLAWMV